jgi:hypothetical protein
MFELYYLMGTEKAGRCLPIGCNPESRKIGNFPTLLELEDHLKYAIRQSYRIVLYDGAVIQTICEFRNTPAGIRDVVKRLRGFLNSNYP